MKPIEEYTDEELVQRYAEAYTNTFDPETTHRKSAYMTTIAELLRRRLAAGAQAIRERDAMEQVARGVFYEPLTNDWKACAKLILDERIAARTKAQEEGKNE